MGTIAGNNIRVVVNARFLCQPLTGVQRFAIEISLRLKDLLHESILFLTPADIRHNEIAEALNAKVIGSHSGQMWEQWDLLSYLKKNGNPILLCLGGGAPVSYKNLVFTLHDIVYARYPQSYSLAYRMFYKLLIPRVLKNAKKIITVSLFSKKEISEYYHIPSDKIEVVSNAVSNAFVSCKDEVNANASKSNRYFLAVSSPAYHKNFLFLVKAFLRASIPNDIQLYIVGALDSNLYQDNGLANNWTDNPRINILGRVSDEKLRALYRGAEAFIFPSLYEGFGIPPLEAQACNCLVLSSDNASMPEVLRDSALYFSPNDSRSLQDKIVEVLALSREERQMMYSKASENSKRFSWNISAEKIVNLLKMNADG